MDWRHAVVGGSAGLVEATIMHPMDTLKTRMQAERVGNVAFTRIRDAFSTTLRKEGLGAFYKGIGPVMTSVVPKVCFQYAGLSVFTKLIETHTNISKSMRPSAAGILTGVFQAIAVVAPMELIKNRQQVDVTSGGSLFRTTKSIISTHGIRGLYRGVVITIFRQAWGLFIKFGGYTAIRDYGSASIPYFNNPSNRAFLHSFAGFTTNLFVAFLVSPLDVVKTRVQLADGAVPLTIRKCVSQIITHEGYHVFFKGVSMRVARIAPGGAIQFTAAEWVARKLDVKIG
eukprot:TRINITY_DN21533_c0_g1_i1.p1 TRINITY_DN21533_c0_g1~~TRINITY_DN21533_c0_g1_i1.p1  ORF type:complete len:285 (+),score=12.58 TRINITY_DN21533_c0_g1_i1:35-889(+)